jgi:ABC-type multidrug transport system fused ATPase/permease subunit
LLALFGLSFGLSYLLYYFLEWTGQRLMQDIRVDLFKHLQKQSVSFFDRNPVGRLVTRLTNDVENCNEMFKSVAVTVFSDFFLLTGILAVLVYLNWRLAVVCFILLPFVFGLALLFSTVSRETFRELRAKVAKLNVFLQERISGMRIIQLFVKEEKQMQDFAAINHENYLAGIKQVRVFAIFMPAMEWVGTFAVALLIWYGGGKVIQNQLSLGALVAFISYLQMFFRPIRDISEKYSIMQAAMASTERIVEFLDHQEEIPEPKTPQQPKAIRGHLEFRDVTFSYIPDQPVLQNISFEIRPGEMVAIVGATGAGKSTIAGLIERFYDPQQGSILLDGIDLRQWPKQGLRQQIGLVMQDVFIFSGSLLGNVNLGQERINIQKVEQAVREANALDFIRRLPGGLEHEIGERGVNLSVGERQLLSFARALAYDPKILILDEATSSVDPETERLIQEAIFKISARRTTLVVAHRLATIRKADRILVMHHGRIREQGRHEELMAQKGIYYKLNILKEAGI